MLKPDEMLTEIRVPKWLAQVGVFKNSIVAPKIGRSSVSPPGVTMARRVLPL